MMEDMSGLWENFHLNDREEVPFEFGLDEEIEQFYLAARFMTSRVLNIESVVRTFEPLWQAVHGFTTRDMGNNILVFAFEDVSDLERVLQSEPRSYDKHLVSFQRVEANTSISEMDCQWVSFWVQIHNHSVRRMNHETALALGGTLGVVEKVVESEEERGREGCMRVRVKVDNSKPLCRGRKARLLAGKETWISFKYERLPNFCYWCGLLTHGDRDCEKWLRKSGGQTSTHGGSRSPKVVKPFMDFTQLKENLLNPLGDDSVTVVNVEQTLPTNCVAPIPSSGPNTAVNHVESTLHSCAESLPDFLQQHDVGKKVDKTNHSAILQDISGSIGKGKTSQPRKKKSMGGPKNIPSGKENMLNNTCNFQNISNGKENTPTNTCDLSGLHEVTIQVESRGSWKRVLRDKCEGMKGIKLQRWMGTRRRLWYSPAVPNESIKLELPGAWEPPDSSGRSGGLALLWNDPAQITIQNFSQNHVDSHVQLVDGAKWRFTGFYGLRVIGNGNLGFLWISFTVLIMLHGCAWGILMKFCHYWNGLVRSWAPRGGCKTSIMYPFSSTWMPASDTANQKEDLVNLKRSGLFILNVKPSYRMCGLVRKQLEVQCLSSVKKSNTAEKLYIGGTRMFQETVILSFFTAKHSKGARTNCLSGLWNSDNVWCTDENQIEDIAVSYFDDIFHTSTPMNLEDTLTTVNSRVTSEANQRLLQPFTTDEVRMALFQMHPSKALGPDGMLSFFFQKYWNIVGANVTAAVLSVFNSGKILRKINLTHISLIPKKKNLERMSEYRPISLCNVVYKIISKSNIQSSLMEFLKGYINPTRGICQGDPLSPYVFLLCVEGLSALFQQASALGHLKGIQWCRGGPWVSHLFFADDSLLFRQANIFECKKILEILNLYEGLPAMIGRSKKSIFNGLKERIVQCLQGWNERFLSKAGREVLIKAVAQAIPTYAMNCFRLPKAWCEEVNGLIARYWWGQKKDERKLHWIKWDKLCMAKAEECLRTRYFPSCSFTDAQMGSNPSFLWRSILSGREVLNKEFHKEEVEDWAVTAWSIWNACNRFVHEDCQVPPQTIRANALALRSEFNRARLSFQH
uniref:Reverse transcriptase domain-containing protein n=1 Tax=Fagus sylvatica TaxID=28930 RepID=A0A2N9GPL3_FAGSY